MEGRSGRSLITTHTTIINKIIYWEIILKAYKNQYIYIYIYTNTYIYIDIYIFQWIDKLKI